MKILILSCIILILVLILRIYGDDKYYENFENADLKDDDRISMNEASDMIEASESSEEPPATEEIAEENSAENMVDLKISGDNENREKEIEMKLPLSLFEDRGEDHGEFCKCNSCTDSKKEYHVFLHHTINDITKAKKSDKKKKINNDELMNEENVNFFLKTIASAGSNKKNKKGKLSNYGTKVPKHIKKMLKPKFSTWHSPTGLIQHFGPLPANEYIL